MVTELLTTHNLLLIVIFSTITIVVFLALNYLLVQKNKWLLKTITTTESEFEERKKQQQVLYNISSSVFILNSSEQIVKNALNEIVTMYRWPSISYIPFSPSDPLVTYGKEITFSKEKIFEKIGQNITQLKTDDDSNYIFLFPVGQKDNIIGSLYIPSTTSQLSSDQAFFFKTIASFLTLVFTNNQKSKELSL